jgi:acetyl-CoA carboxylase biotin carboxylase subunit
MGIATVAVYSECDRTALHTRMADEAYAIGPDRAADSYLRIDKLIDAARRSGSDAMHPGYGFLAENPELAVACAEAGIRFIGPSPESMRMMGDKVSARAMAQMAGVPVVPGMDSALPLDASDQAVTAAAEAIGYPLLVKAAAGGGGKGMRSVERVADLAAAVRAARSEAKSAFGDASVYFERYIPHPRHIEVQLLGDGDGGVTAFVERECSVQRRHQKLIEESPSPAVSEELRGRLASSAVAIGTAARYSNAGTIEFLLDGGGRFYFLEMNTRLQVEHPVTESVIGLDFVKAQIRLAQGESLAAVLGDVHERTLVPRGHAIECRVYAEDPEQNFLPSPGFITHLRAPSGPGVRDDSGAVAGWQVPTAYDPLISKVVTWAPDRAGAISRMVRALREYDLRGVRTTNTFCRGVLESRAFRTGDYDTSIVDTLLADRSSGDSASAFEEIVAVAAAIAAFTDRSRPPVPGDASLPKQPESLWGRQGRTEGLR